MAYSSSIKGAQVQKLCDLCETDPEIKWRCIECNNFMCNNCKNIHLNVQTSIQHEIVDLKTNISDLQTNIITDNISCGKHIKNCCLFCRSCEILVCPDCISSSHHSHRFEPIENVISEKVDELRKFETNIQTDLSQCQTKDNEIQSTETKCDFLFEGTITKIQLREQNLKDAISKYSKQLQDEIDVERKTVKKSLSQIKQKTEQAEKNLVTKRDQIRTALTSNQGKVIFEIHAELKYTSSVKFDPLPSETKQFSPGEDTASSIPGLFGYLKTGKLPQVQTDIDFEVVRKLTTDLTDIDKLINVDETSAWISCFTEDGLRQMKIEQDNIKTIKQISVDVYDMAITSHNDILLSLCYSSDVKLLMETGEIKPFLSVLPLETSGIHVTSDNNVIVGVEEQDASHETTDRSTRAVSVFGMDRKLKKTYQYDKNKQPLFTRTYRVTTNTVNDILVIDETSCNTGRVVVLNREGDLKWTYEGHPKINNMDKFNPRGIVTTTSGYTIVGDYGTHALHVLSGEGHILSYKFMKDNGIKYLWSLDIDRKGQLWMGCGTGGESTGGEIHIVKLLY